MAMPSTRPENKKDSPPKLGEAFGPWAGRDRQFVTLPGGGIVQFDLTKLTLEDFRGMTDHYQVNSSLAVLSFMQHQSDWHIECEDQKIADANEEMLREIWTPLNRSLSSANWSGFSPNILDWENDYETKSIRINKVKDLYQEDVSVHWKLIEGWAPPQYAVKPKFKVYDGINVMGQAWPVPVENSFWYPLLMEKGDYSGRKLLRPAFQSWFFSILLHLFANRYYERFGEPTPIGRAPFDETVEVDGTDVKGNEYLLGVLASLRSRGAVVLPGDKSQVGDNKYEYDYDIEYLESQMRGADFERYLTRLDEEISLALFTPILLMRTADVGSYNLGVGHMQMYLWMLNAMNDDRAQYINKYILRKFTNYNFSPKAPSPKIKFRKLGNANAELVQALLTALVQADKVKVDLGELGQMAGMKLTEVRNTVTKPSQEEPGTGDDDPEGDEDKDASASGTNAANTAREIINRVRPQVERAFSDHTIGSTAKITMGFKRKMQSSLFNDGNSDAYEATERFYYRMDAWIADVVKNAETIFSGPDAFMAAFTRVVNANLAEVS